MESYRLEEFMKKTFFLIAMTAIMALFFTGCEEEIGDPSE